MGFEGSIFQGQYKGHPGIEQVQNKKNLEKQSLVDRECSTGAGYLPPPWIGLFLLRFCGFIFLLGRRKFFPGWFWGIFSFFNVFFRDFDFGQKKLRLCDLEKFFSVCQMVHPPTSPSPSSPQREPRTIAFRRLAGHPLPTSPATSLPSTFIRQATQPAGVCGSLTGRERFSLLYSKKHAVRIYFAKLMNNKQ